MDLTHVRSFTDSSLLQLLEATGLVDCKVIPFRPGSLVGRIQQLVERVLHRLLFIACGRYAETVYTPVLCAVAYRPD